MQISELMIINSDWGYYIGNICTDDDGNSNPYSRSSEYFLTYIEAEEYLYECGDNLSDSRDIFGSDNRNN